MGRTADADRADRRSPSGHRTGCVVVLVALALVILAVVGLGVALWIHERPPTPEERTQATALARDDRRLLGDIIDGGLAAMDASTTRVINDFLLACFGDHMAETGSMATYQAVLAVPQSGERDALRQAHEYLAGVLSTRFGGDGSLSDLAEIDSSRHRVALYTSSGFYITFSDWGTDGFRVEASGPCREG